MSGFALRKKKFEIFLKDDKLLSLTNKRFLSSVFQHPHIYTSVCISKDSSTVYVFGDPGTIQVYSF